MEAVRDLSEVELWQDSLQRSLARRGRLPRSSPELARLRPARDLADEDFMREYAAYWQLRRDVAARRPLMPAIGVGGTIALLAATLPSLLGGKTASAHSERLAYVDHSARSLRRATAPSAPRPPANRLVIGGPAHPRTVETETVQPVAPRVATRTATAPHPVTRAEPVALTKPSRPRQTSADRSSAHHPAARPATPDTHRAAEQAHPAVVAAVARPTAPVPRAASDVPASHPSASHTPAQKQASGVSEPRASQSPQESPAPSVSPGYVNPLAHASVTPERIDQGVDYGGSGPLGALGAGTITYVATSGTGWPGAFIEFRLSTGPDAGRYVFYAESIVPARGLHVGQRIRPGQVIATMTGASGGIEIGWGAGIGTETYAMQQGQWRSGMDGANVPTAAGRSFSALVASLGGPPGKIEG